MKTVTINVEGASQGQRSAFLLELNLMKKAWKRYGVNATLKAPSIKKHNTSKHTKKRTHYSHYYNDESYEFITKLFKKDLKFFGYEFEDKR